MLKKLNIIFMLVISCISLYATEPAESDSLCSTAPLISADGNVTISVLAPKALTF